MAVLIRLIPVAATLAASSACTLYWDDPDPGSVPNPQPGVGLELPCLHEVVGGQIVDGTAEEMMVFYACDGGPIVATVNLENGELVEHDPRADYAAQYRHARLIPGEFGLQDVLATSNNGFDAGIFFRNGWQSAQYHRVFADVTGGVLDPLGKRLVAAGDGALRLASRGEFQNTTYPYDINDNEADIATGRDFVRVAMADLGGNADDDLFFLARTANGIELGAALQTASSPPTFAVETLTMHAGATPQPLLTGDVDGDGVPDVIGALPDVFVRGSRTGQIAFLGEDAAHVAIGDLDGDGLDEPVFVTADGLSIRRVTVDVTNASIVLSSDPWLPQRAEGLVVADLDDDTHDDIIVLRDRARAASRLVFFPSP